MTKRLLLYFFFAIALILHLYTMPAKQSDLTPENLEDKTEKNEKKAMRKKHARMLKQLKIEAQKNELDSIYRVIKKLEKQFNKYEKNNIPYDSLVCKFYKLLDENQQTTGTIPTAPEKLLTVVLTYPELPDFTVHAIMAYVGFNYTKLITSSSLIAEHLTNGMNAQQRFAIPWPKKRCQFLIPDNIDEKPIFSPDGSLLAIVGTKCITVFNTVTGKKIGQCKKLFEGIQLIRFYTENQKTDTIDILVKTEKGLALYILNETCIDNDGIPDIFLLKTTKEPPTSKNITKSPTLTTSSSTSKTGRRIIKTPRKKTPENNIIYTSLPTTLSIGSFLPPYTNRFGVVKRKISASLSFMDLDLNKLFPPEKNDQLPIEKTDNVPEQKENYTPFGLISENGLYGLISTTKKTIDLYGFTGMFPPKEWLFLFCLRYGTYKKPLNPSGAWCSAYYTFNEKERDYLDKTYSFIKPKKKAWSGSIPTLDLNNILSAKNNIEGRPNTERNR